MRLTPLLLGALFILCFGTVAHAQTSVNESDHMAAYNKAHDLFHKKKYAAAQSAFDQYLATTSNVQMASEARYYISVCAAELLMNNAVEKTAVFRDDAPISISNAKSRFKLGQYYFRMKNYNAALFEFIEIEPLLSLDPYENEAYYFMTGYCQFVEGNLKEARAYFDEIKDYQNEYYHLANYFAAYVSFENKEYDKALKGFKRIHKHENFKNFVPIYIAEVYAYNKEYDKLISYGDSILTNKELQKRHVVDLLLAEAYFKKTDYKQSVKYYEKYHDLRKLGTDDIYQYGYASYVLEDYKTTQKQFESFVIDEDSLGQNVSYLLADAYLKNGLKNEARNSFLFASGLDFYPEIKEDAFYHYAKLSHELKFNKAAMNAFNDFIKTYPKSKYSEEAKVNYVRLLLSTNDNLKALEMIEQIPEPNKKIDGGYQRLAYNVGLEYFDIKNYEKSREYLNKSLQRPIYGEYQAMAHFWIGESLYQEERFDESLKSYKNYLFVPESKELPLQAIAHYNLAYCLIKQEEYKEALYHLDNYFKFGNDIYKKQFDSDAHLRTADCYYELKVYDDAVKNYNEALNKNFTGQDYAMFQIGIIKGLQGKQIEKVEWLEDMVKKYPSSQYTDEAIFEKANEKFIMGYKEQALREFEYLCQDFQNNPNYTRAQQKIGLIYYQLDQPEKAIAVFKEVVADFPSTRESKESLRALKDIYTDWGRIEEYFIWLETLGGRYNIRESEKDSATFESALSFLKKGDCDGGSTALKKYLESFSSGLYTVDALYYLADCEYQNNNFNGALNAFDELIERKGNRYYENAIEKAAAICYEIDSFKRAIPYLELRTQIVNNNTDLMQVYEALAKCHLETNNCADAEKYLTKIKGFDNVETNVIQKADYTLARCAMEKGNYTKAISVFSGIAAENDNRLGAEAKYLVAYLYYTKNEFDSSQTTILELKDQFENQTYFIAKSFILLADIFTKKEDFLNAKGLLNTIIENYEGEDLVTLAQEKLAKVEELEASKAIEIEEIKKSEEDTIEYEEK